MRTLHIDTGREDRGGQRQVWLLALELAAGGHVPVVVVPRGAPLADRLRGTRGVELVEAPLAGELSPLALPLLCRLLQRGRFALVHAHTAHAVAAVHVARRLAGVGRSVPLIAHRRVDFALRGHPLARRKRRWPDAWIAVSESVRAQLIQDGVEASRVHVVPSAVDPARVRPTHPPASVRSQLGVPAAVPLLLTIGQLVAHKGHQVVLEALRLARERDPQGRTAQAIWVVVGEGPLLPRLRAEADRRQVHGQVRWLGPREDIGNLLAAAELVLFPSLAGEGSPAAPKEAMLAGTPLLASDLPACRELGLDPEALVPAGDASAWAARLASALAAPEQARTQAARRRALAERFTPAATCAATVAVYEALQGESSLSAAPSPRAG